MRMILTAALAAAFLEAGAQTPPTPPTPPSTPTLPAQPAPRARPSLPAPPSRPAPPAPPAWSRIPDFGDVWNGRDFRSFAPDFSDFNLDFNDFNFDFNHDFNLDFNHDFNFDFNFDFNELNHLNDLNDFRLDDMEHVLERARIERDEALRSVDRDALRDEALRAVENSRAQIDEARIQAEEAMRLSMNDLGRAPRALERELSMLDRRSPREPTLNVVPRAPWLPQDPADSLYRIARDLLNRSQYRSAAETFRLIPQRYPSSGYTPDAMYFEAFSLYKIGGQNELRQALTVLDRQKSKFPNVTVQDPSLATRIRGELANRGDANAAEAVASTASRQGQSCNQDDMAVRLEALSALSRMNVDSTTPILRRVLSRRDECSVRLRRQAITLMAKNPDAATTDIIIDVLKNDPSPEVRRAALSWLGEVPSERGAAALEEVIRSPKDEELQSSALRALASSRNPRASQALRAIIERKDVSEDLRREAMQNLARSDSMNAGAYFRSIYPKLESRRMKQLALSQIARLRGEDNQKWLIAFVRDTTEPVDLRSAALTSLTRSSATPIPDIAALYKSVPEFELKQAIINSLAGRKEDSAVDQLIAIYRASTDPKLNVQIINVLSRRDDPRTQKLLIEILNK